MFQTFVIAAQAENILRVLQRLASLMTRNRLKIQEMQVLRLNFSEVSTITLILQTEEKNIERLIRQLIKFVDLKNVKLIERRSI
jgi:acetolactate synthase small subunit